MKSFLPDIVLAGTLAAGLIVVIDHLTPTNPVEGMEYLIIAILCFAIVKSVHWMLTQFSSTGDPENTGE